MCSLVKTMNSFLNDNNYDNFSAAAQRRVKELLSKDEFNKLQPKAQLYIELHKAVKNGDDDIALPCSLSLKANATQTRIAAEKDSIFAKRYRDEINDEGEITRKGDIFALPNLAYVVMAHPDFTKLFDMNLIQAALKNTKINNEAVNDQKKKNKAKIPQLPPGKSVKCAKCNNKTRNIDGYCHHHRTDAEKAASKKTQQNESNSDSMEDISIVRKTKEIPRPVPAHIKISDYTMEQAQKMLKYCMQRSTWRDPAKKKEWIRSITNRISELNEDMDIDDDME